MKVFKLDSERLHKIDKQNIVIEFMSNLMEGNKEVEKLLPEINLIDSKIGKLCSDVFEKRGNYDK